MTKKDSKTSLGRGLKFDPGVWVEHVLKKLYRRIKEKQAELKYNSPL